MPRTKPKTDEELAAERTKSLPEALSEKALQRVSTGRVRYALSQLAQNNVGNVQRWLDAVELIDGPKAAMELFLKMIEYSVPKLNRTEVKVEDTAGNAIVTELGMEDLIEMVRKGVELRQRTVDGECTDVTPDN